MDDSDRTKDFYKQGWDLFFQKYEEEYKDGICSSQENYRAAVKEINNVHEDKEYLNMAMVYLRELFFSFSANKAVEEITQGNKDIYKGLQYFFDDMLEDVSFWVDTNQKLVNELYNLFKANNLPSSQSDEDEDDLYFYESTPEIDNEFISMGENEKEKTKRKKFLAAVDLVRRYFLFLTVIERSDLPEIIFNLFFYVRSLSQFGVASYVVDGKRTQDNRVKAGNSGKDYQGIDSLRKEIQKLQSRNCGITF